MSDSPHGLTECSGPPHSAQRSRSDNCAMVRPIEMRGSQLIGLNWSRGSEGNGTQHA